MNPTYFFLFSSVIVATRYNNIMTHERFSPRAQGEVSILPVTLFKCSDDFICVLPGKVAEPGGCVPAAPYVTTSPGASERALPDRKTSSVKGLLHHVKRPEKCVVAFYF